MNFPSTPRTTMPIPAAFMSSKKVASMFHFTAHVVGGVQMHSGFQQAKRDIMFNGSTVQSVANIAKGQDRGNAVTVLAKKGDELNMWVLQDSGTNAYESTIIYAPVDINGMQSVMTGCDSSNIDILPSGFSIIADGVESRPSVITFMPEEKCTGGGSLLTIAFQILLRNSPTAKRWAEYVESVNTLISCTLQNIKRCLQCDD